MKEILEAEVIVTALATPGGDEPGLWVYSKLKGAGVEMLAVGVTSSLTSDLKDATGRERPDKSSKRSFPSGHTTSAFSYMTLANRNIDSIDMPSSLKSPLKVCNFLMASSVAWARIEANRHYPSDVLAGAALGHFLTAFIHDAFMNLPEDDSVDLVVFPAKDGAGVALSFRF
jgi:membrane-associated phospholipid phosphatase